MTKPTDKLNSRPPFHVEAFKTEDGHEAIGIFDSRQTLVATISGYAHPDRIDYLGRALGTAERLVEAFNRTFGLSSKCLDKISETLHGVRFASVDFDDFQELIAKASSVTAPDIDTIKRILGNPETIKRLRSVIGGLVDEMPTSPCPACGEPIPVPDQETINKFCPGRDLTITPGMHVMCPHCGHPGTLDDNLEVRDLTPDELLELKSNKKRYAALLEAQKLIRDTQ